MSFENIFPVSFIPIKAFHASKVRNFKKLQARFQTSVKRSSITRCRVCTLSVSRALPGPLYPNTLPQVLYQRFPWISKFRLLPRFFFKFRVRYRDFVSVTVVTVKIDEMIKFYFTLGLQQLEILHSVNRGIYITAISIIARQLL